MTETRSPSSPEMGSDSSGCPLYNDIVAARKGCEFLPSRIPIACIAEHAEGIVVRDRALRAFCRHLLGSDGARPALIDDTIDGLLTAVARGMPIALRGASDLVPVAYALHRRILGADHPFVVCDPRRCEGEGSVRVPPSRRTGALALEAAIDGSICLRSRRLPADFDRFRESLRDAVPTVTVFVCLHRHDRIRDLFCRPLEVPSLAARASESDHLLQEALDEASTELGAARLRIPRHVRQGVLSRVASFADLEKTALRVVALVSARNPTQAAARLGMAPVSLMRWLHRRPRLIATLSELKAHRDHDDD